MKIDNKTSVKGKIEIYCDGGARGNPGPAAAGFVVFTESKKLIHSEGSFLGKATNNIAEYQAVIIALIWLKSFIKTRPFIKKCTFYLDSSLVVNQLKGNYKVMNEQLRGKYATVEDLRNSLTQQFEFVYIPREQNHLADQQVNLVLDKHLNL